jgi:CheY-like chemotaxis protein
VDEDAPSKDEEPLYVESVEIREIVPNILQEDQIDAPLLRSFFNAFRGQLYRLIKNSRDALKQMASDHSAYGQLRDIANAADELESALKRLQSIVEGDRPESAAKSLPSGVEGASGINGTETVLVADDDESVRNLVVLTLEQQGYTVFGAASGLEAIARCKAYPGPIHLLLADVGMEHMDGYQLVRQVLLARPDTKAIYMSGNFLDHARAMVGTGFLLKGNELVDGLPKKVRQMLGRVA